jgi:hypothetical protein
MFRCDRVNGTSLLRLLAALVRKYDSCGATDAPASQVNLCPPTFTEWIEYGLWPNRLGVVQIPGAMPLAILNMALGHGFVCQRRYST